MIEFDEYKQKILALQPTLENIKGALKLDEAGAELRQLEEESARDGFWNDLENSQKVLQRIKQLKNKSAGFEKLSGGWSDLLTLCQMAMEEQDESLLPEIVEEYKTYSAALETARLDTLLSGEFDGCDAILSFHAGAGGTEAQDWAEMLLRMYLRWAERRGFKAEVIDRQDGDEAGIDAAAFTLQGENAFGFMRSEIGVHRLVRISPFDANARRHTSFAAVEVTADIEDEINIDVRDEDLEITTMSSFAAPSEANTKTVAWAS